MSGDYTWVPFRQYGQPQCCCKREPLAGVQTVNVPEIPRRERIATAFGQGMLASGEFDGMALSLLVSKSLHLADEMIAALDEEQA